MHGIKRRIFVLAPSEDSLRVLGLFKTGALSVCNYGLQSAFPPSEIIPYFKPWVIRYALGIRPALCFLFYFYHRIQWHISLPSQVTMCH